MKNITEDSQTKNDDLAYKFEIFPGRIKVCNDMTEDVYSTNYDSLYLMIKSGGFNLATGEKEDNIETYVPTSEVIKLDSNGETE